MGEVLILYSRPKGIASAWQQQINLCWKSWVATFSVKSREAKESSEQVVQNLFNKSSQGIGV